MSRAQAQPGDAQPAATREGAIVEALALLMRLRPDVATSAPGLLADLEAAMAIDGLRERTLHRFAGRLFCVLRYRQLRRSRDTRHMSNRQVVKLVDRDARAADSRWRCAWRSFQEWAAAWNHVEGDGLAAGPMGLLWPTRRGVTACGMPGRPPSIFSPEAVESFRRMYIGPVGPSVAKCHRRMRALAEQRGWSWPKSEPTVIKHLLGGRVSKRSKPIRRRHK